MKVAVPRMTIEDLQRIPNDGNRYELIDGELFVTAAPRIRHQRIVVRLISLLDSFIRGSGLGEVLTAPVDVFPKSPSQTCVQPDLIFVSSRNRHIIQERGIYGSPDLLVEIISDSSFWADQRDKLELYRNIGVVEYWIVFPEEQYVLVYRFAESPGPQRIAPGHKLTASLLPGLEIDLTELFSEYERSEPS